MSSSSTLGINLTLGGTAYANVNWNNPGLKLQLTEVGTAAWYYSPDSGNNIAFRCDATGSYFSFCSNGGFFQSSDKDLKTNIQPIENSLEYLLQLNPVTYQLKEFDSSRNEIEPNGPITPGFIAQESESLFPLCVQDSFNPSTNTSLKSMNYIGMIPYLVKSIQEQQVMINALNQELTEIKQKINTP